MTADIEGGPKRRGKAWATFLKLFDLLIVNWFFSFVCIIYFAATTDLLDVYIFPEDEWVRYAITFGITYVVLFVAYVFQDEIQVVHHWLARNSCCIVEEGTFPKTNKRGEVYKLPVSACYYDMAFFYRAVYGYVIGLAYVAQWHCYWGAFEILTKGVHYGYLVLVSVLALAFWRVVLNGSMELNCEIVPLCLVRDTVFYDYFEQSRRIKLKRVKLYICSLLKFMLS
jgi:hypothetical protein